MKKNLVLILAFLFLMPARFAYGATLMHMFVKHEIKAELQDIADKYVDKETQKEIKQKYKEYKKEQKRQDKLRKKELKHRAKMHKKKLKRIEAKKKQETLQNKQNNIVEAQKVESEENFEFQKYNNPPGSQDLDFFGIYGKRQINSIGVVSPDFSKMIYTEIHFYPSICQLTTELFLINLPSAKTPMQRVMDSKTSDKKPLKFYAPGMEEAQPQIFKTMTMVDWSCDGSKFLAKEKIAENLRGFLETRIWVYEIDSQKTYKIQNIRKQIEGYWSNKGLDLTQCKWDIAPIGWYEPNNKPSDNIIVDVHGYKPDKTKVFLGSWLVNYKTGETSFIENPAKYQPSQNGMVVRPKLKIPN